MSRVQRLLLMVVSLSIQVHSSLNFRPFALPPLQKCDATIDKHTLFSGTIGRNNRALVENLLFRCILISSATEISLGAELMLQLPGALG
mgnify:CR=1 FL=1